MCSEILITPHELQNCSILKKNIMIKKSKDILISGVVLDYSGCPIVNAIIEIIKIQLISPTPLVTQEGYILTNKWGKFAVLLEKSDFINYQLEIYEPILKTRCEGIL